ncbi:MAG: Asp-tRNA(Asn)/Glu-tRNA(Gln) amidotransferase subunit GatA [Clostridiales bacterium]|nr:Asp-tRNA(Asn)/Glu-tRNA(Gln) amidotransferase subunit GatA [Clostridiales bacterium]
MNLSFLTAEEMIRLMESGEMTSLSLVERCLDVIREKNPLLNAFVEIFSEEACKQARESDQRRREQRLLSPLDGVPCAIKDNLLYEGHITSCASRMLENFTAPYTATAVQRLRQAGMPILGRLNMDEFAMGSASESSFYGPVRNPLDPERVAGGSSGGSACAVAAGMVPLALGSDTGGSVRQPAALCGVVGVKPAYGTISRYGLVAHASSMDQVGVFAHTAQDAALLMQLISGGDPLDMTSDEGLRFTSLPKAEPSAITLALPAEWFGADGCTPCPGGEAALAFARLLEKQGARLKTVSIPSLSEALPAYMVLSCAEASSNLSRFDGLRYGHRSGESRDLESLYSKSRQEGFGDEVKRRILLGTFALSSGYQDRYYLQADALRRQLIQQTAEALEGSDAILCPVSPRAAWKLGQKPDSVTLYQSDLYTVPANLTGLPAISFPWGLAGDMPGSAGLMGHPEGLGTILALAQLAQSAKGGTENG